MRASTPEQTGSIAASEVAGNFERINWGPVPNSYHDLGTDLLVQARDARMFDLGLLIGVQVKGGPSFFKESEKNPDDEEVAGWWYRESTITHFHDWVRHDLPHLLVLHDLETRTSYWKHVTSDQVIITGKGAKIFVPKDQTIDSAHVDALLTVAASRRAKISYEGSLWAQGADSIPPASRLRYALIAPRIITPHRNAGYEQEIGPLEAISLLTEGRIRDLDIFTEKHNSVPTQTACISEADWRWKFHGSLYTTLSEGETSHIIQRIEDAHSPENRAAACVVSACMLMDLEEYEKAHALLSAEIDRDEAGPTDFAWLLTQRGRLRAEMGDVASARDDAARAQRELIGTSDDITASAIKSAAASLLFDTAPWENKRLKDTAAANDTTISWWRSRNTSTGLSDFFDDSFREWTGEHSRVTKFEDIANNRLFAAQLNANLVGEHGVWRALASLLARHTVMMSLDSEDYDRSAIAINDLRRSGDASALEKTLRQIRRTGPLTALKKGAAEIDAHKWTHTTARSNLAFWQICGDLLNAEQSDAAVQECLDILSDTPSFTEQINPTFRVNHYVPRAISGLLPSCNDETHRRIAKFLSEYPLITDIMTIQAYAAMVEDLRADALSDEDSLQCLQRAHSTQTHPKLRFPLTRLLSHLKLDYKDRLLKEIAKGDIDALISLRDMSELDSIAAAASAQVLKNGLEKILADARKGSYSHYELDIPGCLSLISVLHPEYAEWDLIERFLIDKEIPSSAKRQTFISIAHGVSSLPPELKERMRDIAIGVPLGVADDGFFGPPIGGVSVFLVTAIGGLSGDALNSVMAQLINGSVQERCDAAAIMSILRKEEYSLALVALLDDRNMDVRISAARAVATWAAECGGRPGPAITRGLDRALTDTGFQIPMAITDAVTHSSASEATAAFILEPLKNHPSAIVRRQIQPLPTP